MIRSPEIEATIDELCKHGAVPGEIVQGKKHAKLYFVHQGRTRFVTLSITGSDRRAAANARQTVRRELGIKRTKKTGTRRISKDRLRVDVAEPPKITIKGNPFEVLRERIVAHMPADQVWAQWFGGYLRQQGHTPVMESMR